MSPYLNNRNDRFGGSFFVQQAVGGGVPVSICMTEDKVIRDAACHSADGYPESVLYRLDDGRFNIARVKHIAEINATRVTWAVGGMGLLQNYDPAAEGFVGKYSDVLRATDHAMLGVKNGCIYMVLCRSMTGREVNDFAQRLGLEMAIMLDGGHIAGMNGAEPFARVNTAQIQSYVIQAI
jgi:hypothetical protein